MNTREAIAGMVEALERWKCDSCAGTGRTLIYADGDRERFERCRTCDGGKLHPTARAALKAWRERVPLGEDAVMIRELRRELLIHGECTLTPSGAQIFLGFIEREAIGTPTPAATTAEAPPCECEQHTPGTHSTKADYLITRAGRRIAVCDRCTLPGDDLDDRDLNPDWSARKAAPAEGSKTPSGRNRRG